MKNFTKGIIYAFVLNITNFMIGELASNEAYAPLGVVLFALIGMYFLRSETIGKMLACGFTALPFLFIIQIWLLRFGILTCYFFEIYVYGLIGTIIAVVLTTVFILTGKYSMVTERKREMDETMVFDIKLKIKMLVYLVLTALSFAYLVLADNAGVSVLVFAIVQAIMMYFVVPEKKRLLWLLPIGILCLNSFISANTIWRVPNVIVCIVLFGLMFTPLDFKNVTARFLGDLADRICAPIKDITTPFEWFFDVSEGKKGYVKRGALALVISLAAVGLLGVVLSSADMVFNHAFNDIMESFSHIFSVKAFWKIIVGVAVGIYLFGAVYNSYFEYEREDREFKLKGDGFIITFVMLSVLAVYTVFVFIQFRYLFSGSELPYGLNVTEYARKGFFELLGLTGVNIAIILLVTKLTEHLSGKRLLFVKVLNMYLCAVTVVLLVSSFYRMQIYNETDGLTRLRFLVFGFLAFEFIGLIMTFVYIAKPKFNIVMVYGALALCYYLVLNVVPMDAIVAKNQVDRYLKGERTEIEYVLSLSPDAADEVERICRESTDYVTVSNAKKWVKDTYVEYCEGYEGWRSFNLSKSRLCEIYEGYLEK